MLPLQLHCIVLFLPLPMVTIRHSGELSAFATAVDRSHSYSKTQMEVGYPLMLELEKGM